MALLDPVGVDSIQEKKTFESIAAQQLAAQGGTDAPGSAGLALGSLTIFAAIVIGLALFSGGIKPVEAGMIFGAVIGLVMLFAVLKLFTIATTLKDILAEMRTARTVPGPAHKETAAGK